MTRSVTLFRDGTARVGGIEADALGDRDDLPFLSEAARIATAKAALAQDDMLAAEAAAARGVISDADVDLIRVTFVEPPDWARFGEAVWNPETGMAHAVFTTSTLLVDGMAIVDCVGLPFEDETARRECAAWCLRNNLEDMAECVGRTPVGGDAPYCTWPDRNMKKLSKADDLQPVLCVLTAKDNEEPEWQKSEQGDRLEQTQFDCKGAKVVSLFGGVYPLSENW